MHRVNRVNLFAPIRPIALLECSHLGQSDWFSSVPPKWPSRIISPFAAIVGSWDRPEDTREECAMRPKSRLIRLQVSPVMITVPRCPCRYCCSCGRIVSSVKKVVVVRLGSKILILGSKCAYGLLNYCDCVNWSLSNGLYWTKRVQLHCDWSSYYDYSAKNGSHYHAHNRNSLINCRCDWTIRREDSTNPLKDVANPFPAKMS